MGADRQFIDATITELSSDACGSRFRVRVRFSVPIDWLNPQANAAEDNAQSMEFYFDDSGLNVYVLLNCFEEQFNEVRDRMISDGIPFTHYGLCYRPASNGRQYQWYIRIDQNPELNRGMIDAFFKKNFDLAADHENIRVLEEAQQRFEAEIVELQATLAKYQQEAKDYENLADEIDEESKAAKQEHQQRIEKLQAAVKASENEIQQIEDEKRRLRYDHGFGVRVFAVSYRLQRRNIESVADEQLGRSEIGEVQQRGVVGQRGQVFRFGDPQLDAEAVREPSREAEVVRMVVGDDHPLNRTTGQTFREDLLPVRARRLRIEAGIDQRPAGPVAQDP